jgi:hypothetical protein
VISDEAMGQKVAGDLVKAFAPRDVATVIGLALDIARYRASPIGADLARAAWVELFDEVTKLPEAGELAEATAKLQRRSRRRWWR